MLSSQDGQTALRCASSSGHTDVVKLLVDSGAHINNKDKVSTEPSMVLHRDSSLMHYLHSPLTLSHSSSFTLLSSSSLSCGYCFNYCLSLLSNFSVKGVEVVRMCVWCLKGNLSVIMPVADSEGFHWFQLIPRFARRVH